MAITDEKLEHIVVRRARLIQFLILVIAMIQCVVLYAVLSGRTDWTVPAAVVVALFACLYTGIRERKLSHLHSVLFLGLASRKKQVKNEKAGKEKLANRLGEMTLLYRSISQVNAVPNAEGVFNAVVDAALELVDADVGSLMLFDETANRLILAVGRGLPKEAVVGSRRPADTGVAGWVLNQNHPLILDGEAADDDRFSDTVARAKPVRSSLCIPLALHGERVGVLSLGLSEASPKPGMSEFDRSLASIFAQHAAVSVKNARLLGVGDEVKRLTA